MLGQIAQPIGLSEPSLLEKIRSDYYKNKKEQEIMQDYSWQIRDINERLNQQDFVIQKLCELIEKVDVKGKTEV